MPTMNDLSNQCKSEGSHGHGQTGEDNFGEGLVRLSVNRVFVHSSTLFTDFISKMQHIPLSMIVVKLTELWYIFKKLLHTPPPPQKKTNTVELTYLLISIIVYIVAMQPPSFP